MLWRTKLMTIKRMFINEVYGGDYKKYLKARKDDYCRVQFEWSCFIDSLCKGEAITLKQYERATF